MGFPIVLYRIVRVVLLFALVGFGPSAVRGEATGLFPRVSEDSVRLAVYNVYFDSLFQPGSGRMLERLIAGVGADVYAFQEVSGTDGATVKARFDAASPTAGGWDFHKSGNNLTLSRYTLFDRFNDVPGSDRAIARAGIDLPDESFRGDMHLLNSHFACCGNEPSRQNDAEAITRWMDEAMTPGGLFDLDPDDAIVVAGDLNIVGSGRPLQTLITGDGMRVDWDDSDMRDAAPTHNGTGVDRWTWRNDDSPFPPGILDYTLYTDSVITQEQAIVINPATMTSDQLAESGFLATDFRIDPSIGFYDHLPLVIDFAPTIAAVPEPGGPAVLFLGWVVSVGRRRSDRRR